jgi:ankyrin repeat protein
LCGDTSTFATAVQTHLNISDLGVAAIEDDVISAAELVAEGCDINHHSSTQQNGTILTGVSPLMLAIKSDSVKVLQTLLSLPGPALDSRAGQAALSHQHALQGLSRAGAELGIVNSAGSTPLYLAAAQGNTGAVQALLHLGADVQLGQNTTEKVVLDDGTVKDRTVNIPSILAAAEAGHTEVVSVLLAAGADVNTTVTTSRHFLATFSHNQSYAHRCTPLHAAVVNHHTDTVRTLLEAGSAASYPSKYVNYPLHLAARHGYQDIARLLLAAGAEVDQVSLIRGEFTPAYEAAKAGQPEILQILYNAGSNLSMVSEKRHTFSALHIAAVLGHTDTVRTLLELGVPVDQSSWGEGEGTALSAALTWAPDRYPTSNLATVQVLLEYGATLDFASDHGQGLLSDVISDVKEVNIDFVKFLVETEEIDINKPKRYKKDSPLSLAVDGGQYAVAEYLVSAGADVNHISDPLRGAVYQMFKTNCSENTLAMIEFLLQNGAEDLAPHIQKNLLYIAAQSGCLELVKLCVEYKADVENSNALFAVPTIEIVKYLLEEGANIELKDKEGKTALYEAAARGRSEIVAVLVESGAVLTQQSESMLNAAAELGINTGEWTYTLEPGPSVQTVKTILHLGGRIRFDKNGKNESILSKDQMEKFFSNADIVRELVRYDVVDIDMKTEEGTTPLMFAATLNSVQNLGLVKYLVSLGADVHAVDTAGDTVIHKIIKNKYKWNFPGSEGYPKILSHLVKFGGASLNIQDRKGMYPLQHGEYVKELLGLGAWVNISTKHGDNLLHLGIEPMETLIASGVDLNARNDEGETPLFKAREFEVVKILVDAGADINITNNENKTVIFHVAQQYLTYGSIEKRTGIKWDGVNTIKYLVDAGAAIVLNTTQGPLPLTYVLGLATWRICGRSLCYRNTERLVNLMEFLYEHGGDVDAYGPNGLTSFQNSVLNGETRKAKSILIAGADIDLVAEDGKTALTNATVNQDVEIIMFLITEGADLNKRTKLHLTTLSTFIQVLLRILNLILC